MPELLSTLVYALRYNLTGLLIFAAAVFFARRGRTFWHWFFLGLFIQGYSILGTLMGIHMEPEQWRTMGNYAAVALFAVLAVIFALICLREEKKLPTSVRKARAAEARKAAQDAAKQQK